MENETKIMYKQIKNTQKHTRVRAHFDSVN